MAAKLSVDQSFKILDVLATFQHIHTFKMVFYPDRIEVGNNLGPLRAAADLIASSTNLFTGAEETRELAALHPLLERVNTCLTEEIKAFTEAKRGLETVKAAQRGLIALQENQYSQEAEKKSMLEGAYNVLTGTRKFFEKKVRTHLEKYGFKDLNQEQTESLFSMMQQHERTIQHLRTQLTERQKELQALKVNGVIQEPLSLEQYTNPQLVNTLGRITDILASRARH